MKSVSIQPCIGETGRLGLYQLGGRDGLVGKDLHWFLSAGHIPLATTGRTTPGCPELLQEGALNADEDEASRVEGISCCVPLPTKYSGAGALH